MEKPVKAPFVPHSHDNMINPLSHPPPVIPSITTACFRSLNEDVNFAVCQKPFIWQYWDDSMMEHD